MLTDAQRQIVLDFRHFGWSRVAKLSVAALDAIGGLAEARSVSDELLCRLAATYRPDRGPVTWFVTHYLTRQIREAAAVAIDHAKRRRRVEAGASRPEAFEVEPLGTELSPRVVAALQWLTPKQRYVVHRVVFDEVPIGEVGREMGLSLGGVQHHWRLALDMLREVLT